MELLSVRGERLFRADGRPLLSCQRCPSCLEIRVLTLRRQSQTGPVESLTMAHARGRQLCVFGQLVRISPVGEAARSLTICHRCHARVLAEHMDHPPIYWEGCPYVGFKKA